MTIKAPQTPTFPDVMDNFRRDLLYGLYCHLPGAIIDYDRTKRTASVQIGLKRVVPDLTASTGSKLYDYPKLTHVPVFALQGGGAEIGADPVAGDPCLLCVADRNIDAWFQNGGAQAPLSDRAHDLSDAFALVGFNPLAKPLATARAAGETGIADAAAAIVVKDGKVGIRNGPLPTQTLGGILEALFTTLAADPGLNSGSHTALNQAVTQLTALLE